eukprot:3824485-Rhodomonas_salina.1
MKGNMSCNAVRYVRTQTGEAEAGEKNVAGAVDAASLYTGNNHLDHIPHTHVEQETLGAVGSTLPTVVVVTGFAWTG